MLNKFSRLITFVKITTLAKWPFCPSADIIKFQNYNKSKTKQNMESFLKKEVEL